VNHGHKAVDCYDGYVLVDNCQLICDAVSVINASNSRFSYCVWHDNDAEYIDTCENCNNIFGCIGLKKKSYCILNKQYSKEEYESLVPKIIQHMKDVPYTTKNGVEYRYGEYFPIELSPFAYNETVAQEYFPLSKEEAQNSKIPWKAEEAKKHSSTKGAADLPGSIDEVDESILNEIISCEHEGRCNDGCITAYKITSKELQLYRTLNIPLPALCHNCRHARRLRKRNPFKLNKRKCMKSGCNSEFQTAYSPDRPEIVYCESCYQQEVI